MDNSTAKITNGRIQTPTKACSLTAIAQAANPADELQDIVEAYSDADARNGLIKELSHCHDFQVFSVPNTIGSIISGFLAGNPTEKEFYQSIWTAISSDTVFPSAAMKEFALRSILVDSRMPYHYHELLSLDEDDYAAKYSGLEESIDEIRRIIFRQFAQKTEEASALLDVIESQNDRSERAILLGCLLATVRSPEPDFEP